MLQNGLYNAVSWAVTLAHQEKNIHQQGIYNSYSPKLRWLVVDIYQGREAAR